MNKTFRLIWSEILGAWVVASEIATAKGKGKNSSARLALSANRLAGALLIGGVVAMSAMPDFALAAGPQPSIPGIPTGSPNGKNGVGGGGTGNPGIWVNDSTTGGCIVAYDAASGTGGGTGNQWFGLNNTYGSSYLAGCDATSASAAGAANVQTNRVLFYGAGPGAVNLSLGGQLYVNAGRIGVNDYVNGTLSMAIGNDATTATGSNSVAIGNGANTAGANSVALGMNSNALGNNSVAQGYAASASATNSLALGTNANASAANSVALGAASTTTAQLANPAYNPNARMALAGTAPVGEVSVGSAGAERRVTNMAAGAADTDGVNVSQLKAATTDAVTYDDGTHNTITLGGNTYDNSTHIGGTTITNVADGSAPSDAVNYSQLTTTNNNVTNLGSQVDHIYNTGTRYFHANSTGTDSLATGADSVAIGMGSVASNANDVALGAGSTTAAAVGTAGTTIAGNTYAFAGANPNSTVSVGSVGNERTITNVAAGRLNGSSTDAVNGSQLFATNEAIDSLAQTTADADKGNVKYDTDQNGGVNYNSITLAGPVSSDGGVTGGTRITNVAQGDVDATSTDAINGAQLYAIAGDTSNAYITRNGAGIRYVRTNDAGLTQSDAFAQGEASTAVGYNALASGSGSLAMGKNAVASNANDVALGAGSTTAAAVGTAGTTIAGNAYAFAGSNPNSTVSVGSVGNERTITNVAAGQLNGSSTDAVNGSQLYATNQAIDALALSSSNVFNTGTKYFHANSTGVDSSATGMDAVAIGMGAVASSNNSVALGAGSVANRGAKAGYVDGTGLLANQNSAGTVSVGAAGAERQITNVAAGSDGTDAVNVDQLNAALKNIGPNPVIDGGSSMFKVSDDYNTLAPQATGTQSVAGGSNAIASGNNSTALGDNSQAAGDKSTAVGRGARSSGSNSVALGSGSDDGGRANVVSVGSVGNERQIINVAPGAVNATSTDAVNGSQLNATNNQVTQLGNSLNSLENIVNHMDHRLSAGVAAAMASAGLPQAYRPGANMVSISGSGWNGESGMALGISTITDNGRWVIKATGNASSRGDYGGSVGAGYQW